MRAKIAEVESLKIQVNSRADEDLVEEETAVLLALAKHPSNEEASESVVAKMAGSMCRLPHITSRTSE